MNTPRTRALTAAAITLALTAAAAATQPQQRMIDALVNSSDTLKGIAAEPERYRLQILVADVVTGALGEPVLQRHAYRENREYWYPASTVKLCSAVAALRRLEELNAAEPDTPTITADTPLRFEPLFDDEHAEHLDPTNPDTGRITLRTDIRHALIVSDNPAANRLYEFAGQHRVNAAMHDAGLASAHILHRLSEFRSPEDQRRAPAIIIETEPPTTIDAATAPPTPATRTRRALPHAPHFPIGRAHINAARQRVNTPLTFTHKNFISLRDLQSLTAMIARPDIRLGLPGLDLRPQHRQLLYQAITTDPSQSDNPRFDTQRFSDNWPHYFKTGLERVAPRQHWTVANKVGLAYGFVSETAYIHHEPTDRGVFLAMCLYVNDNAVLNDSNYNHALAFDAFKDAAEFIARRLLQPTTSTPDADTPPLIDAPSPWTHTDHRLIGPDTGPLTLKPGQTWTSPHIHAEPHAAEAIVSWNVDPTPNDNTVGLRLDVRAHRQLQRSADQPWSDWLAVGELNDPALALDWNARPADTAAPANAGLSTAIDTLFADPPAARLQFRITAVPQQQAHNTAVTIRRLDVCLSAFDPAPAPVPDDRALGPVVNNTPFRDNTATDQNLRSRLCSPLSLRMLLAQRGIETDLNLLAQAVHDDRFNIYGNWTRAIQAAHALGAPGQLTRFSNWNQVRNHLETRGPIAVSALFAEGEISNAPYGTQAGHLFVIDGLDHRGDALVLDPALSPEHNARRTYARDELSLAWLRRVKGLAYTLDPNEPTLTPDNNSER